MAPKAQKTLLSNVNPTKEEIEAAKATLANSDAKAMRSKMGSLSHFLKQHPDCSAEGARGDKRKDFLLKFLVHQARSKQGSLGSEWQLTSNNQKNKDVHWWSSHKMDQELGHSKAEGWRAVLKPQPDSLTGSTAPDHVEYPVPVNWERMSEAEIRALKLQGEQQEATEDDVAKLLDDSLKPTSAGSVEIKVEPENAMQKLDNLVKDLKENKEANLRKFQDMELKAKQVEKSASKSGSASGKWAKEFLADLGTHVKKLAKVTQMLKKFCTEDCNEKELPKLLQSMQELSDRDSEIRDWGVRFGFIEAKKRKKGNKD